MGKPILIKFNIIEIKDKMSNQYNFHLDQTILTTTLHKSVIFWDYLKYMRKELHKWILAHFDKHSLQFN
jgi:uncharacterized protein (DUF927 family)